MYLGYIELPTSNPYQQREPGQTSHYSTTYQPIHMSDQPVSISIAATRTQSLTSFQPSIVFIAHPAVSISNSNLQLHQFLSTPH